MTKEQFDSLCRCLTLFTKKANEKCFRYDVVYNNVIAFTISLKVERVKRWGNRSARGFKVELDSACTLWVEYRNGKTKFLISTPIGCYDGEKKEAL